jgi:hypothetical protein
VASIVFSVPLVGEDAEVGDHPLKKIYVDFVRSLIDIQ